jgi:hypothetical protein
VLSCVWQACARARFADHPTLTCTAGTTRAPPRAALHALPAQ